MTSKHDYLIGDFNINRKKHFFSIFYQAREAIVNPGIS